MSKGLLLLWLVMELWWLYLTPAASEDTVIGFLGQSVTLPCHYSSWSQSRNSMCWGKGTCPKSKCNAELLHTDGTRAISRKSRKYTLKGNIQFGDVSLTIENTNQGDSGVYCCRIEVPGWFNDVKKTVRLELRRATTTKRPTTTTRPTTTPYMTTTPELLPTTVMTTPAPTTTAPPHTLATTAFSTAVTTYPSTISGSFSQETTSFPTTEIFTKGSTITAESETLSASKLSQRSMMTISTDIALFRPTGSKAWLRPSTSQLAIQKITSVTKATPKTARTHQINNKQTSSLIIACCVGFVVMVLLFLAFLLRGKVTEANCLQRHKRPDNTEDSKSVLNDMSHGREDEDGLFTL
ncbi:T-cell immunoglobulin and mucin domain-containing protein 4-like isoform X2 [Arvicanthis niloticus]|uniref:T-cell immunoglobulin and mucin domain-containing protein 4-like isoform X2 n=1 Tax=Arvicanthis niloticus TaxID=61156 RepID=UPI0014869DD4|nr:T-cell immunoglobulin and mucin domain-containing protein 4-like isoform X1 [Arvicanthis niloticus]